ncbi:FG-GAP repeat protein [Streptomyces sp. NPDC005271]|uniref:FG-GAP and VCBS repeat-containing protein n=1 Tax=unclassified Streptomyces TaxID=2593676 RepID=UPI0033B8F9ED
MICSRPARGRPESRARGAGELTVVHGAKSGLGTGRPDLSVDQSGPGVPGDPQGDDGFGASPAVGDVNADGRPDLVVATRRRTAARAGSPCCPGPGVAATVSTSRVRVGATVSTSRVRAGARGRAGSRPSIWTPRAYPDGTSRTASTPSPHGRRCSTSTATAMTT